MTHYQIQCPCLLLVPHQYSINAKVDHLEYNITLDDGCLQMDGYSYYRFFHLPVVKRDLLLCSESIQAVEHPSLWNGSVIM